MELKVLVNQTQFNSNRLDFGSAAAAFGYDIVFWLYQLRYRSTGCPEGFVTPSFPSRLMPIHYLDFGGDRSVPNRVYKYT